MQRPARTAPEAGTSALLRGGGCQPFNSRNTAEGAKLVPALKTVDALAPVTSSMRFADDGEQRYGSVSVYQLNRGAWFLLTRSDVW